MKAVLLVALFVLSVHCQLRYIGQWQNIPGGLRHISVDRDGRVWGVNSGHGIYTRDGPGGNWQHIPGGLMQISVSNGRVWGVNSGHQIYTRDGVGGNWQHIPGGLIYISVDVDGRVWGVNAANNIYTRDGVGGEWQQIPGGLRQVEVNNGLVCGTNSANNIYCREGVEGNWQQIPGGLVHVSVDSDGGLFGTNSAQQIFYKAKWNESFWIQIPGGLRQANINNGVVWGCNAGQGIYVMKHGLADEHVIPKGIWAGQFWQHVPGGINQASIDGNGDIWGVNTANNIYFRPHEGNWQQIPGGLANIAVSNGVVWGCNGAQNIYHRAGVDGSWTQIPGGLRIISVNTAGRVWGVNSGQGIYTRDGPGGNWQHIPGGLAQIDVSGDLVYGRNAGSSVFYRNGVEGNWVHVTEIQLIWVSIDGNRVWGITGSQDVWTKIHGQSEWQYILLNQKNIKAQNGYVVATNAGNQVYISRHSLTPEGIAAWRRENNEPVEVVSEGDNEAVELPDTECAVVFTECNFRGESVEICDRQDHIDVQNVRSVYIPPDADYILRLHDQPGFEGQTADFSETVACLEQVDFNLLMMYGIKKVETKKHHKLRGNKKHK